MPTKESHDKEIKTEKPEKQEAQKTQSKPGTALPGKDLATAGFAVAVASVFTNFFTLGIVAVIGLVLSIMGRVQTAKAGQPSTLALAGIIISGVVMALTFMAFVFFIVLAVLAHPSQGPGTQDCSMMSPFDSSCNRQQDQMPMYQYRHSQG